MRQDRAFTLIELLFVVAIIAILAAISVPNFLDAQTRAKIARVQSDMSTMKAALRAYGAQQEAYPPNSPEILKALQAIRKQGMPAPEVESSGPETMTPEVSGMPPEPRLYAMPPDVTDARWLFLEKSGWDLVRLTTPNAWLTRSLPVDPFYSSPKPHGVFDRPPPEPFVYINRHGVLHENGATTSAMEGKGFMLLSYGPDARLSLPDPLSDSSIAYDPTNGTTSAGDLVLTGW